MAGITEDYRSTPDETGEFQPQAINPNEFHTALRAFTDPEKNPAAISEAYRREAGTAKYTQALIDEAPAVFAHMSVRPDGSGGTFPDALSNYVDIFVALSPDEDRADTTHGKHEWSYNMQKTQGLRADETGFVAISLSAYEQGDLNKPVKDVVHYYIRPDGDMLRVRRGHDIEDLSIPFEEHQRKAEASRSAAANDEVDGEELLQVLRLIARENVPLEEMSHSDIGKPYVAPEATIVKEVDPALSERARALRDRVLLEADTALNPAAHDLLWNGRRATVHKDTGTFREVAPELAERMPFYKDGDDRPDEVNHIVTVEMIHATDTDNKGEDTAIRISLMGILGSMPDRTIESCLTYHFGHQGDYVTVRLEEEALNGRTGFPYDENEEMNVAGGPRVHTSYLRSMVAEPQTEVSIQELDAVQRLMDADNVDE
jgi:hypothetical protein